VRIGELGLRVIIDDLCYVVVDLWLLMIVVVNVIL
jgi:hypothetical protein